MTRSPLGRKRATPNTAAIGIIYARVSTRQQEKEGTSLDTQIEKCLALALEKGIVVPVENILRERAPGDDPLRPKFLAFNEAIEKRQVRAAFLYDADRYAREPLYMEILAEMCEVAGVMLYVVKGTSGTGIDQKFLRYVEGYVAKKERMKTLERTTRGKMAVLKAGRPPHGWGHGIYGYDYDKETQTRTINDSEAFIVRRIFESFVTGASYFQIAEELNNEGIPTKAKKNWHGLTIRRILQNQTYTGLDIYGKMRSYAVPGGKRKVVMRPEEDWIYVTDFTPPIIDQDLFARAQDRVKEIERAFSRRYADRPRYWLSGYIFCKRCGNGINGATNNRVHRYYRCRGASKSVTGPRTCNTKSLRADELEEAVWEKLVETLQTPQVVMLGMQDHVDLGQGLNAEIRDLENAISNLVSRERNLICKGRS